MDPLSSVIYKCGLCTVQLNDVVNVTCVCVWEALSVYCFFWNVFAHTVNVLLWLCEKHHADLVLLHVGGCKAGASICSLSLTLQFYSLWSQRRALDFPRFLSHTANSWHNALVCGTLEKLSEKSAVVVMRTASTLLFSDLGPLKVMSTILQI